VNIFDIQLKDVLQSGVFKGIDNFGQALIETSETAQDGSNVTKSVSDGRMRLKTE
jgi:hypothetical protein